MNTHSVKKNAKFNFCCTLFGSVCIPTIVMEKLCQKLNIKITALTWTTQSGYFNTIEKVNNDFPLPKYSATLF